MSHGFFLVIMDYQLQKNMIILFFDVWHILMEESSISVLQIEIDQVPKSPLSHDFGRKLSPEKSQKTACFEASTLHILQETGTYPTKRESRKIIIFKKGHHLGENPLSILTGIHIHFQKQNPCFWIIPAL